MHRAEEFVSMDLLGRDLAHLEHWKTDSYARHKALEVFYDGLLDLLDGFVEQYQGAYGKRMNVVRASDIGKPDIKQVLGAQLKLIKKHRYEICEKDETALQNTLDEIVALYQSTLYQLTLE